MAHQQMATVSSDKGNGWGQIISVDNIILIKSSLDPESYPVFKGVGQRYQTTVSGTTSSEELRRKRA